MTAAFGRLNEILFQQNHAYFYIATCWWMDQPIHVQLMLKQHEFWMSHICVPGNCTLDHTLLIGNSNYVNLVFSCIRAASWSNHLRCLPPRSRQTKYFNLKLTCLNSQLRLQIYDDDLMIRYRISKMLFVTEDSQYTVWLFILMFTHPGLVRRRCIHIYYSTLKESCF